jgi:hypothetical protein
MGSPRCPSCKKPFHEHLGLSGTCAKLKEAQKTIKQITAERDAARKENRSLVDRLVKAKS